MQQAIVERPPCLVLERWLDAPREIVWRSWVDAARLARWWAPPAVIVIEYVLEPAPGGRAVFDYRDAGGRCRAEGRVTAAEAPAHLAFRLAGAGRASGLSGYYHLTLSADGRGTLLRLRIVS